MCCSMCHPDCAHCQSHLCSTDCYCARIPGEVESFSRLAIALTKSESQVLDRIESRMRQMGENTTTLHHQVFAHSLSILDSSTQQRFEKWEETCPTCGQPKFKPRRGRS